MDMTWQITAIINTANELQRYGSTGSSIGEHIVAAFVLNRPEYSYCDLVEAWDRLGGQWQDYVRLIKRDYMHLIEAG